MKFLNIRKIRIGLTALVAIFVSDLFLLWSPVAQAQNLEWVRQGSGEFFDKGFGIALDVSGNSYVTGAFENRATFGSGEPNQTILTGSAVEIFVAKYNSNGNLVWAKKAGGAGSDVGFGIALDVAGNSYVTGRFQAAAIFGPGEPNQTTLTAVGGGDIFVAKYDSNGAFQWVRQAGGPTQDPSEGHSIAIDGNGNSYVTGNFAGPAIFGPGEPNQTVLTSISRRGIFVAKYNSNGALQWARQAGGPGTERLDGLSNQGSGIALDVAGNSYVTGNFEGTATFGSGEPNQTTLTAARLLDIFVAKYDSSGALQWVKQTSGSDGTGYGMGLDGAGNIYVTGVFQGNIFNPTVFGPGEPNQTTLIASGFDFFVAKYDSRGTLQWVKHLSNPNFAQAWDEGRSIAIDGNSNSYVTGYFEGTAIFGVGEPKQTSLTSLGQRGIFVAKYDSNGAFQWVRQAGASGNSSRNNEGSSIGIDKNGNSYVTGAFGGTVIFGPREPNQTILTASDPDIFVAKFARDNLAPVADAGPNVTVECTSSSGALVSLDGTNSSDPDEDSLTFSWSAPGIVFDDATSQTPSATFPLGVTTVTLTVTDSDGLSDGDTANVIVQDTTPPAVSVAASPTSLWPPNHKHVPINLSVSVSDICDPLLKVSIVAKSNEPDDAPKADGSTTGDIRVTTARGTVLQSSNSRPKVFFNPFKDRLELRAERNANGVGRTYSITVTAETVGSLSDQATANVTVPLNRRASP